MSKAETVLELMHDARFMHFRDLASKDILRWSEFRRMDMPVGYTAEETWAILNAIKYQTAEFTTPSRGGWYVKTNRIIALQSQIHEQCMEGSSLERDIAGAGHYIIEERMIEDIAAAAFRDGVDLDEKRIRSLCNGEVARRSESDIVVNNLLKLLDDLTVYKDVDFSPKLLRSVYFKLLHGAELFDEAASYFPASTEDEVLYGKDNEYWHPDIAIEGICSIASSGSGLRQDPVVSVCGVSYILWMFRPFGSVSAFMEIFIRRLIYLKAGYAVLCWIPFSKLCLDWEQGRIVPPAVPCSFYTQYDASTGEGLDSTASVTATVGLSAYGLALLEKDMENVREKTSAYSRILDLLSDANRRQRGILLEALLTPERRFRIEPHRRMHGVSYRTARADFLELEARGYLRKHSEGRAFVFTADNRMQKLLEENAGAVDGEILA